MKKLFLLIFLILLLNNSISVVSAGSEKEEMVQINYEKSELMRGYDALIVRIWNIGFSRDSRFANYSAIIRGYDIHIRSYSSNESEQIYYDSPFSDDWIHEGDFKEVDLGTFNDFETGVYVFEIIIFPVQEENASLVIPRMYLSFDFTLEREATMFEALMFAMFYVVPLVLMPLVFIYQNHLNKVNLETYSYYAAFKHAIFSILSIVLVIPVAVKWIKKNRLKFTFFVIGGSLIVAIFFNFDSFISGVAYWIKKLEDLL
ncbi:MAG: hypothetical protein ACTSYA_01870 [Candidatus Kariarchaeaceae archaeon]